MRQDFRSAASGGAVRSSVRGSRASFVLLSIVKQSFDGRKKRDRIELFGGVMLIV
jgi:hypothetical protein